MVALFQQACLDYIQLQDINYRESFACEHGCDDMTADGLTLGFRLNQLNLKQPWAAPSTAEPKAGSLPAHRLLLTTSNMRARLLAFADGCAPAELQAFIAAIAGLPPQAPARALLPFLRPGPDSTADVSRPPSHVQKVLYSLGTTAAVCTLLPPVVYPAVLELLQCGSMGLHHHKVLLEGSPVLHKFVKPALQHNSLSDLLDVKSLLRVLLEVRVCSLVGKMRYFLLVRCSAPGVHPIFT